MTLSVNQILYISVISCLFVIFNIMILMKDKIKFFNNHAIFIFDSLYCFEHYQQ